MAAVAALGPVQTETMLTALMSRVEQLETLLEHQRPIPQPHPLPPSPIQSGGLAKDLLSPSVQGPGSCLSSPRRQTTQHGAATREGSASGGIYPTKTLGPLVDGLTDLINTTLSSPRSGNAVCAPLRTPVPGETQERSGSGDQALLRHHLRRQREVANQLSNHISAAPTGSDRRSKLEVVAMHSELLQHEIEVLIQAGHIQDSQAARAASRSPDILPPKAIDEGWNKLESNVERWCARSLDLRATLARMGGSDGEPPTSQPTILSR
eukprot:Hpha_TRINITY_DN15811_c3_g1::TRINITY_DN15811_c3_g1_i1::g.187581::m.187581